MRTYLFIAVLFGMFIFTITAAMRPDMVIKEYERVKAPVAKIWNQKQEAAWRLAKEKEWQDWSRQIRLPADCENPQHEIRKMECRNQWQLHADTFERSWDKKVASGWKPEGVF